MNPNQRLRRPHWQQKGKLQIYFSTKGIVRKMKQILERADTPFVVGCCRTCTHTSILNSLGKTKGVSIIVADNTLRDVSLPRFRGDPFRVVRGMDQQFFVGLNSRRQPVWACTFSFELTPSFPERLCQMVYIQDKNVATFFAEEYMRVFDISAPIALPAPT